MESVAAQWTAANVRNVVALLGILVLIIRAVAAGSMG